MALRLKPPVQYSLSIIHYPLSIKSGTSDLDLRTICKKVRTFYNPEDRHDSRKFVQTSTDIKAIREKMGLSQQEFAALLCISRRTLEGWEQGHRTLTGPVRALLTIFKHDPESAMKALHGSRLKSSNCQPGQLEPNAEKPGSESF
jgi:putative transcriptional regulator